MESLKTIAGKLFEWKIDQSQLPPISGQHPTWRAVLAVIVFTVAVADNALAHLTLETPKAPAGSFYKAVLGVIHGCQGSATTAVRVKIPEGVTGVRPMPKPGWELNIKKESNVIAWTGGHLPNHWYNEFVFVARLPEAPPGTMVYFPVVQECVEGVNRWIAIPTEGKSTHEYDKPAPGVMLTAAEPGHGHEHGHGHGHHMHHRDMHGMHHMHDMSMDDG